MFKNLIINISFALIILLITFFGLGPVFMADGQDSERITTLFVVILLYAAAGYIYWAWRRKNKS